MIPGIEPVESLLVTVGLRSIVTKKVERFTKAKLDRMRTLPNEIQRLARDTINNKLTEGFYSDLNYRSMLKDLARGVDMHQVQDMIEGFPPEYQAVGNALMIMASQTIAELAKQIPTSSYQTVAGLTTLLPDDLKLWRFVSILEVLDNPLEVFPLIATGALLRSQAAAVRQLYPTISAHIDAWLLDATIKAKAKVKSFELAPRAEIGVRAWMGQSPVGKGLLSSAQATLQAAKVKRAVQSQKKSSKLPAMSETGSQRSDMGAP